VNKRKQDINIYFLTIVLSFVWLGGSNAMMCQVMRSCCHSQTKIRRQRKYNSAARRQIFGGLGAAGYSVAAEFGGAGISFEHQLN
jgi:hypothetical protein